MSLELLGWNAFYEAHRAKHDFSPARVVSEGGNVFLVDDGCRESFAVVRGGLRRQPEFPPVAGDWVLVSPGDADRCIVESILPRRTAIARKRAGPGAGTQILAANVDRVLLVTSMDQDFSVRRLERYLTLIWESGATPILALTKADLVSDPAPFCRAAEGCALGFPVLVLSSVSGQGMQELRSLLAAGETIVLLGSSGVGKSTLVNALAGQELRATQPIRQEDGKGRHTTSDRRLLRLPSGVLLIDTPGLREVQLWAAGQAVEQTFPEISALAVGCRFRDCRHDGEPGCAVRAGLEAGGIEAARLASFHRLRREVEHLQRQNDPLAAQRHKRRLKQIMRAYEKQHRRRDDES
jgi:ribosome biogenesis GTPase